MKYALASLVVVALVAGCKGSSNPADVAKETAKTYELQAKTFESQACSSPVFLKVLSAKGYKIRYQFKGNSIVRSTLYYPTSDCKGAVAMTFVESGTFKRGHQRPDGSYDVDMAFTNLKATVNSQKGKVLAEQEAMGACGNKTWQIGRTVDVTAKSGDVNCYQQQVPEHIQDVYLLDGTKLYFGNGYDYGKSGKDRADQLNRHDVFVSL